jgi:hypothetical protein
MANLSRLHCIVKVEICCEEVDNETQLTIPDLQHACCSLVCRKNICSLVSLQSFLWRKQSRYMSALPRTYAGVLIYED